MSKRIYAKKRVNRGLQKKSFNLLPGTLEKIEEIHLKTEIDIHEELRKEILNTVTRIHSERFGQGKAS